MRQRVIVHNQIILILVIPIVDGDICVQTLGLVAMGVITFVVSWIVARWIARL
jgi:hypothetical protein